MASKREFADLANLFKHKRIAITKAATESALWSIEQQYFQNISTEFTRQTDILKSISIFKDLPEETLINISEVLEETFYNTGEYIIQQGTRGDTFFIINKGKVKVTIKQQNKKEKYIRTLQKGDFFGEEAFQRNNLQTANIIACDPDGVSCMVINRETFNQLVADLDKTPTRNKVKKINSQTCDQTTQPGNLGKPGIIREF